MRQPRLPYRTPPSCFLRTAFPQKGPTQQQLRQSSEKVSPIQPQAQGIGESSRSAGLRRFLNLGYLTSIG
jgi:hypothetical protein